MAEQKRNQEPFRYKPLKPGRRIRLLHLKTPHSNTAPLECRIKEVDLNDDPEYTAMSYAWDAETRTVPLLCNGNIHLITPNCEKGLRRFAKIPAGRIMWVDSICIDQDSIEERNHQVEMMGTIYTQASTVLVWLGDPDEKTSYGFDQLRYRGEFDTSSERSSQTYEDEIMAQGTDFIPLVFEKSWFHRMWVIQEASLPDPNRVLIFLGQSYIRWKHFIKGVLRFGELRAREIPECMDIFVFLHGILGPNRRLIEAETIGTESDNSARSAIFERRAVIRVNRPLRLIISKTGQKRCHDSRDRIFALNSVFKALLIRSKTTLPVPDYKKTYAAILHDLEVWLLGVESPGSGDPGIEVLSLDPKASSTVLVNPVGLAMSSLSLMERSALRRNLDYTANEVSSEIPDGRIYSADVLGLFVREARSYWDMAVWIDAIVSGILSKDQTNRFRSTRILSKESLQALRSVFVNFSREVMDFPEWRDNFDEWASILFALRDLEIPVTSKDITLANAISLKGLDKQWQGFRHWWPAIRRLNTVLGPFHGSVMTFYQGRTLLTSTGGHILLVNTQSTHSLNRIVEKPVFLILIPTLISFRAFLLHHLRWQYDAGNLTLFCTSLARSIPPNHDRRNVQACSSQVARASLEYIPLPIWSRLKVAILEIQHASRTMTHALWKTWEKDFVTVESADEVLREYLHLERQLSLELDEEVRLELTKFSDWTSSTGLSRGSDLRAEIRQLFDYLRGAPHTDRLSLFLECLYRCYAKRLEDSPAIHPDQRSIVKYWLYKDVDQYLLHGNVHSVPPRATDPTLHGNYTTSFLVTADTGPSAETEPNEVDSTACDSNAAVMSDETRLSYGYEDSGRIAWPSWYL